MEITQQDGKIILNKTATEQNEVSSKGLIDLNNNLIAERDRIQAHIDTNIALLEQVLPIEAEIESARLEAEAIAKEEAATLAAEAKTDEVTELIKKSKKK